MGMTIDDLLLLMMLLGLFFLGFYFGYDFRKHLFKKDYENRLKADLVAMLTELQLEIEEIEKFTNTVGWELRAKTPEEIKKECSEIIQQKINSLKEGKEP